MPGALFLRDLDGLRQERLRLLTAAGSPSLGAEGAGGGASAGG